MGTLKRTITLLNGTKPAPPPHIVLRGINSNTFDLDVGAKRSKTANPMNIIGYRFELLSKEDHRNNGGKWINAHVIIKEFTDGENNKTEQNTNNDGNSTQGVTYFINNLSPNTTYLVRVASINPAGLSDWMGPTEFTTYGKEFHPENSAHTIQIINFIPMFLMYLAKELLQFYLADF